MNTVMLDSLVGNDYSLCLCNGLKGAGVEVSLIVPVNKNIDSSCNSEIFKWSPPKGGALSRWTKGKDYLAYLVRVYLLIKRKNAKVVHFQFLRRKYIDTFFILILKMTGVKLVYTAHNILPHESTYGDKILNKFLFHIVDAIIVHSEFIKNKLLSNYSTLDHKLSVVAHGNFDSYVTNKKISKIEAKSKLGIDCDYKVVLFFGYIRDYKGLDLALEAFDLACLERDDLRLVIAGSPQNNKNKEKYSNLIDEMSFKDNVISNLNFINFDDVAIYFTAADIVVLPYRKIDHSGIIHLAYSFGRPVIATQVGDFEEVIEEGASGYLVRTNDPEDLARGIITAFSDGKWPEEAGAYAKRLSDTRFSWDVIGKETKLVYEKLL